MLTAIQPIAIRVRGDRVGVDVVGEARNAEGAQQLCDEEVPEVAFIDLRMPDIDGIVLAQQLRRNLPELDVIIVSAHGEGALRGFETNVTDYLLKPVRLRRLQQAIDRVSLIDTEPHGNGRFLQRIGDTFYKTRRQKHQERQSKSDVWDDYPDPCIVDADGVLQNAEGFS